MKNAQLLLDDEESMTVQHIEEGIRQVKVLIKHLAIFFLSLQTKPSFCVCLPGPSWTILPFLFQSLQSL